jgi:hypothetical protein
MLWDLQDVVIETDFGPYETRVLVGQPNAGCLHRHHPSGMMIYMYNDDPGVYYNERGGRVSDTIAAEANFDVETYGKAHRRKLAYAKASGAVDAEFEGQTNLKVLKEQGEYRLVELGKGVAQVQFVEADGKGAPLTGTMTLAAATKLFDSMLVPEE